MQVENEEATGTAGALVSKIVSFLESIGLRAQYAPVPDGSFLPGIELIAGGLRLDPERLLYPGDLLHEAGHLAVMETTRRDSDVPMPTGDGGEEIAAIAWSYAAAVHLGIAPEVIFHPHGYKDGSEALCSNFREGRYLGVPLLQWMGLTTEPRPGTQTEEPLYPQMKRWLRD